MSDWKSGLKSIGEKGKSLGERGKGQVVSRTAVGQRRGIPAWFPASKGAGKKSCTSHTADLPFAI